MGIRAAGLISILCLGFLVACGDNGRPADGESCTNGIDDDGDGAIDCADPDCSGDPACDDAEVCDDGTDNDGDGAVDCADSDCAGAPACALAEVCDDGTDNDGDGATDCADSDCGTAVNCLPETSCDDGVDNDGDGATDCADADCAAAPSCIPEANCMDGIDDDGDGTTDCADADCAAAPNCVPEANCADGIDDDLDGSTDCDDTDCAAAPSCNPESNCFDTVDDDLDGNTDCADTDCAAACASGCPAGQTAILLASTDVPKPFGLMPPTTTSVITVNQPGVVTGVAVAVDVTHPYVEDVTLSLQSPAGGINLLTSLNGSSGDDYVDTLFTDAAPTSITDGAPPFTGSFQPEQAFTAHDGSPATGTWTLDITDAYPTADDGTLTSFDLYLCVCDGIAGCEVGFACRDGLDNDVDGLIDCADTADCGADPTCLPESVCDDGSDDDLDGATDCADMDCDGITGCEFAIEATCGDGYDNDADGATDCVDANCDGVGTCELGTELTCGDGIDNDADGAVDCGDVDCTTSAFCSAEVDCDDGLDNDADGLADCLDVGCDGQDGCELGSEVSCSDGFDNDADGAADCADPECAGTLGCVFPACAPGMTRTVYTSTDVPVAVPDLGTGSSTIPVAEVGLVADAAMRFSITHAWDADLDLQLAAPGGVLDLSSDNGSSGDNYTGTILTDAGPGVIGTTGFNTAPFSGMYRPEQAFSNLYGAPTDGDWDLVGTDDEGGIEGTIVAYELLLCWCDPAAGAPCEFGEACRDGLDNDGNGLTDCAETACAADLTCIPETACDDGLDNDLDGVIDCADSQCDGIGGCEFPAETSCADAFDNDGDGASDCVDTDCAAAPACQSESSCTNGIDDDNDGQTDCADSECATTPICTTESSCSDLIDNDGDGQTDCGEPGCDGQDGCTFGVENACNDLVDNDGDGLVDGAEPVCAWVAPALPACPAGQLYGYRATDVPITISSAGTPTVNSFLSVTGGATVADLAVRINITHSYDSDLDILLFSPAGTSRELSTDNGTSGDNFTNTVFTDSGPGVIGTTGFNNPPFAGTYQPEQAFAPILVGEATAGSWNLRITDQFNADGGTLNEFSLAICRQ